MRTMKIAVRVTPRRFATNAKQINPQLVGTACKEIINSSKK